MAGLFFQYLANYTNKKIQMHKFLLLYIQHLAAYKLTPNYCLKISIKMLPKWLVFAKSGHTGRLENPTELHQACVLK